MDDNEIITETANDNVISIQADFSNLTEVKEMADEITNRYSSLDLLINNAGATFTERTEGMDGNELTLTINYLAPFLLTNSLLPLLRNGGNDNAHSKIINVSFQ